MMQLLTGIDHAVFTVPDLDAAAAKWRALGFTVSPRGMHPALLGTGNYTMMLEHDYLELVGVLQPTELNAPSRSFLARHGEGVERVAFATPDAPGCAAALRARGLTPVGPVEFSRPVPLSDGSTATAAFTVIHWPFDKRPADMRIFACQHHNREHVWLPALQQHANTASRILRVELVSPDPGAAARQLASLTDGIAKPDANTWRVHTASHGVPFVFCDHAAFCERYADADPHSLPTEGVAALVIGVRDIAAAARVSAAPLHATVARVEVAPERACGVRLVFEPVVATDQ